MTVRIIHGNCLDELKLLPDNSVDSIVTDPPYGLEFMGKEWDSFQQGGGVGWKAGQMADIQSLPDGNSFKNKGFGQLPVFRGINTQQLMNFQQFCTLWATECRRVLKHGGYLLAFGGPRMYHRLACGIEDAGFEIRDQIMWVYGSGFPKSHNLKGDWAGWGTALKPAHEPIVMARKPLIGTVAANVLEWGTGAINIDGTRVGRADDDVSVAGSRTSTFGTQETVSGGDGSGGWSQNDAGRWAANFIHDGSDEVLELFPETAGGARPAKANVPTGRHYEGGWGTISEGERINYSSGSAARFFYCAKPNKKERNAGTDGNKHPTVKPIALMRYLCRLVTPPNGTVLDPFAGSGTTLVAAVHESFNAIGIEMTDEYLPIIRGRVQHAENETPDTLF